MHNDTAFGREVAVGVLLAWRPRVSKCGHQNIFGNHITPTLNCDRRGSVVAVERLSAVIMCHHEKQSSERDTSKYFIICPYRISPDWLLIIG